MQASPATPAVVLTGGAVAPHSSMSLPARAVNSALPEISCPSLRAQARLDVFGAEAADEVFSVGESGFKDAGTAHAPNANKRQTIRALFAAINIVTIDSECLASS